MLLLYRDKHKRTFSLVEQCRVTSRPCPQMLTYLANSREDKCKEEVSPSF